MAGAVDPDNAFAALERVRQGTELWDLWELWSEGGGANPLPEILDGIAARLG